MKKTWLQATISAAAVLLSFSSVNAQSDKPWIVGEVVALTGPAATVGTRLNKSIKMWVEEVNAAGGIKGRKIEHRVCNDENRPEKAVACARDMIDQGAVLLFGNVLTASLRAVQPLVKNGPLLPHPVAKCRSGCRYLWLPSQPK